MTLQLNISRYIASNQAPRPLLYISCANFGRDTAEADFIPLVSYATPTARRDAMLPGVFLSDDSGGGSKLADDIIAYLQACQIYLLPLEAESIQRYCCDLIHHLFDPDLPGPSQRLMLGWPD